MTINNQLDETEQSELLATGSAINDLSDSSTLNRSEFDMNNIYLTSQKILSEDNDTDTSDNIESLMEKAMTFRYQKPSNIINNINRSTATAATLATAAIGASVILQEENNSGKSYVEFASNASNVSNSTQESPASKTSNEDEPELTLWQFCRLYRIGKIPIMDFIVVYIILYALNCIFFHFDYKLILISTVPITLILEILTNQQLKVSAILIIILLVSVYYLLALKHGQNQPLTKIE